MGRAELTEFVKNACASDRQRWLKCSKPMCPIGPQWDLADLRGFKLEWDGDGDFFDAHRAMQNQPPTEYFCTIDGINKPL